MEFRKKIAVIGLGYVGLPIAVAFAKKTHVIGFDINKSKIKEYLKGIDLTNEVGNEKLQETDIEFTSDESKIKDAEFIIVAVPTPVYNDHLPDLRCLKRASQIIGRQMKKGSIIVYESTVYPGCTEDICIPILEKESGLKCPTDFKVGYSPERINPGDKIHCLSNITKIVSGIDEIAIREIKKTYDLIIEKGTLLVSNIKTAEAIKVIENSQRDVNIAFMNEISIICNEMGIDINEVIKGMQTKWNALSFTPGLVGGHCIGVDPYYLIYAAERMGYYSEVISSGRLVNEKMGTYVADIAIKKLILAGKAPKKANVVILGFAYKENCNDIRNSKVVDILTRLKTYGIAPIVVDPLVNKIEVMREYGIKISNIEEVHEVDCLIFAVAHNIFKNIPLAGIRKLFRKNEAGQINVVIDLKRIFSREDFSKKDILYVGF